MQSTQTQTVCLFVENEAYSNKGHRQQHDGSLRKEVAIKEPYLRHGFLLGASLNEKQGCLGSPVKFKHERKLVLKSAWADHSFDEQAPTSTASGWQVYVQRDFSSRSNQ